MMTMLSMLTYGDAIYKTAPNHALNKLDFLYHGAIWLPTGAPFSTHHCELYKLMGWSSLHTRQLPYWLLLSQKSLLGKTPQNLSSLLHYSHYNYHLRYNNLITFLSADPHSIWSDLYFAEANDWNFLQNSLKFAVLPSHNLFKQKLQQSLVDCCAC